MDRSDDAVLTTIEQDVLQPEVVSRAIRKSLDQIKRLTSREDYEAGRPPLERRLETVERDLARLTAAVTAGGDIPSLVEALKAREIERADLERELRARDQAVQVARLDTKSVEQALRAKLDEWKALLRRHAPQARQILKKLLAGPIVFTPIRAGQSCYYEFKVQLTLGRMIEGLTVANSVASPPGIEPGSRP